jgi:hypothetical protein
MFKIKRTLSYWKIFLISLFLRKWNNRKGRLIIYLASSIQWKNLEVILKSNSSQITNLGSLRLSIKTKIHFQTHNSGISDFQQINSRSNSSCHKRRFNFKINRLNKIDFLRQKFNSRCPKSNSRSNLLKLH